MAGWFAGRNRYGTAFRTALAGGLEQAGASLPGDKPAQAGGWVAANSGWLRVAVGILGVVVLLWGNDVTISRWWWTVAIVLALLAIIQVLVGAARRPAVGDPVPDRDTGRGSGSVRSASGV